MQKKWAAAILILTVMLATLLVSCGKTAGSSGTAAGSSSPSSVSAASSAASSSAASPSLAGSKTPAATAAASSASSSAADGGSKLTKDSVFDLYNKVKIDASKTDVNSALKVTGDEEKQVPNSFTYRDPVTRFGVYVTFDDKDIVTSKTLMYPDSKDLAFLFTKPVTEKQCKSLTKDMDYDTVKAALGEDGIERNVTVNPYDGNKLSHMYYWVNKDGSLIQAMFSSSGKLLDALWHTN